MALFFRTLAKEDFAHRIFVQPLDIDLDTSTQYYLTCRTSMVLSTAESQFRRWLFSVRNRESRSELR